MNSTLATTPLHDWHVQHGGRMVDFAGWSMPVQYGSIVAEHQATRTAVGLFDIAHMGRLRFDGPDAVPLLERLLPRRIADIPPGAARYTVVLNERAGILDDVLVYHLRDAAGGAYHLMVVNASNRERIVDWIARLQRPDEDCRVADLTADWAMIAVQGPAALDLVRPIVDHEVDAMRYYGAAETAIAGRGGIVSRTGYTGEDGVELIVGAAAVEPLWCELLERGAPQGAAACGLACRDTLRLEAGMALYGHELTEDIDPYQAGLGFAVDLDKGEFIGRAALVDRQNDTTRPVRVGLKIAGRRAARENYAILAGDEQIGHVTSGSFSPTLEESIAMGYVDPGHAQPGTIVQVDIRGRATAGHIVKLPFYRRKLQRDSRASA